MKQKIRKPLSFIVTVPLVKNIRGVGGEAGEAFMCLNTKIRKKIIQKQRCCGKAEHTSGQIVMARVFSDRLPVRLTYATAQPELPEPPFSASVGRAVVGSESEVSKTMEGDVAKRSIAVSN